MFSDSARTEVTGEVADCWLQTSFTRRYRNVWGVWSVSTPVMSLHTVSWEREEGKLSWRTTFVRPQEKLKLLGRVPTMTRMTWMETVASTKVKISPKKFLTKFLFTIFDQNDAIIDILLDGILVHVCVHFLCWHYNQGKHGDNDSCSERDVRLRLNLSWSEENQSCQQKSRRGITSVKL